MAVSVAHAIIGTAGHIDHGKTALVKALTGQDTDRLKEEKERGISIDLGFAYFTLPDGTRAGVVDVPGHERFIRNMLAGAHGIDLVLFTVAADDGVMPQSEEHLDILHVLGVSRGIFVITKSDLADRRRLTEVGEEIGLLAEGTALENAPTVAVCAQNGAGLEELRAAIVTALAGFQGRRATGLFRLPVDRAFVIKGHGTVVTGTAMGGEVRVGQTLRVLPAGEEVRVRSIQVHSESVLSAGLCQRVALNLSGAEKLAVARGDVLADARLAITTKRFDARLEIRPGARRALRHNQRVRVFIGTRETMARAILIDPAREIPLKGAGLAQLVLDEPVVALCGDRFVIRDETNRRTLGGGRVLNPLGRRVRRTGDFQVSQLRAIAGSSGAAAVEALLNLQEDFALSADHLAQLLNLPIAEVEAALAESGMVKLSLGEEPGFTTPARWKELKRVVVEAVSAHHQSNPLSPGLEMEELRARLPYAIGTRPFRALLDRLAAECGLTREESTLRLASHLVTLGAEDGRMAAAIEAKLSTAAFQPPDLRQLAEEMGLASADTARVRALLGALERQGKVVRIGTDLYFARQAFEAARGALLQRLESDGEITAAVYRDILGASRKFAIALLDYFDHNGLTTRVGDTRRLRAHGRSSD